MTLRTIEERRLEIRSLFIEEKWFVGYNVTLKLLNELEPTNQDYMKNMFFCNTYLSIGIRRMGDNESAIKYAETALKYSTSDKFNLIIFNTLANCWREDKNYQKATEYYDKNIKTCDSILLDYVSDCTNVKRLGILEEKANAIHNKGDMLGDISLIIESIRIYEEILSDDRCNVKSIKGKKSKAYKNLNRIHNELSSLSSLSSPLKKVL